MGGRGGSGGGGGKGGGGAGGGGGGGLESKLNASGSREAARALLVGVKRDELNAMAKSLNIPRYGSLRGDELRREIVDATIGRQLDTVATRGFTGARPVRRS